MIFEGDPLVNLEEITRDLIRGLPSQLSDPYAPDKSWTQAVLGGLCDLETGRGFYVCCHSYKDHCTPTQGEWLLDVVWMIAKEWKIALAAESEWGGLAAVEEDFGKLLSIKARHKLFLFATKNHQPETTLKQLEANMVAYPYHLAGEEYMLLEITAPGAFRYRFEVPHDGRLEAVRFQQLGEPLAWPW